MLVILIAALMFFSLWVVFSPGADDDEDYSPLCEQGGHSWVKDDDAGELVCERCGLRF